jgi:hypothetical protein
MLPSDQMIEEKLLTTVLDLEWKLTYVGSSSSSVKQAHI